jgi:hypothetical protein
MKNSFPKSSINCQYNILKVESINFNSKPCIVRDNDTLDADQQQQQTPSSSDEVNAADLLNKSDCDTSARFYLNDLNNQSNSNFISSEQDSMQAQQSTTSPDSKRFKCELLQQQQQQQNQQQQQTELSPQQQQQQTTDTATFGEEPPISTLSRLSEFNRSKKVFEQLEDKLKKQKDKLDEDSSKKSK